MNAKRLASRSIFTVLPGGALAAVMVCALLVAAAHRAQIGSATQPKTADGAIAWKEGSGAHSTEIAFSRGFAAFADARRTQSQSASAATPR